MAVALRTAGEIDALAAAAATARDILTRLAAEVATGVRGTDLDAAARDAICTAGGTPTFPSLGFPHALALGVNDTGPNRPPTDRPLRRGDVLIIDVGLRLDGWCADRSATIVVDGGWHPAIDLAEKATAAAIHACQPGGRWADVGDAVRSVAGPALAASYRGHGIGRRPHEPPWLGYADDDPLVAQSLVPGMVFTVEPVIAVDGAAVWLERTVAVTPDGPRSLPDGPVGHEIWP